MWNKMKYFVLMIALLCVVAIGLYERKHHTDYLREYYETGETKGFKVTFVMPKSDAVDIIESGTARLQRADHIFVGKMCGMPTSRQSCIQYPIEVLSVCQGEDMQEGEIIQYVQEAVFSSKKKSWSGGFTNLLKEDKRYLFFVEKDERREDTYLSIDGDMFHYFCLDMDMTKDYVNPKKYKAQARCYDLESVKNNEFFVQNKTVLKQVNEMKSKMMMSMNININ